MPFTLCKNCGRNICHPVQEEARCTCNPLGTTEPLEWLSRERLKGLDCIIDAMRETELLQAAQELVWLYPFFKKLNPRTVLEIGVHQGGTMMVWHGFCKLLPKIKNRLFVGVDINTSKIRPNIHTAYTTKIVSVDTMANHAMALVETALEGREVDFLYIDGEHKYEFVKNDYEKFSPLVRSGGIIAFHDVAQFESVRTVFDQIDGMKYTVGETIGTGVTFKK